MEEVLTEMNMCNRKDVQEISDRLRSHVDERFDNMEKRMHEIAASEVRFAKDNFFKYIGWGGVVGIAGLVYFFGGLQTDFENVQEDINSINSQLDKVEVFMSSGDRFTTGDGLSLEAKLEDEINATREYSDNKDELIIQRLDSGFETLSRQLQEIKNEV